MAISNGYCTLAEFKAALSEATVSTNAGDDAVMEDIIEAASRHIDNETRRRFYANSSDETRTYKAASPTCVFMDDMPAVASITSLKIDQDGDRTYETTLATTDYDMLPSNAVLNGEPFTYIEKAPLGNYTFPSQVKGVQIVGKFGYASTTPDDIKQACIGIAMSLYQSRRGVGVEGIATVTAVGVVITPKDVPQFAAKIIAAKTKNWGG